MRLSWEPLGSSFGAEVMNLDLSQRIDAAKAQALRDLWRDRGLLLFRGQKLSNDQQIALSRIFGELETHPAREAWVEGHPELTAIQYHPADRANSSIYAVDGVELANWLPWHIDLIYMPRINRAGCLRALLLPTAGADTGFIDRADLYDTLPASLKARIEGRRVVYRLNPHADQHRFYPYGDVRMIHVPDRIAALSARVASDFPDVSHPVAFAHPDSGRMILNITPLFLVGIEDMDEDESDSLLSALVDHVLAATDRYYHRWQDDDVILWDNWRMLHSAEGTPVAEARKLHRTTIAGDYGFGRFADAGGMIR